jgi:hypothetical protein
MTLIANGTSLKDHEIPLRLKNKTQLSALFHGDDTHAVYTFKDIVGKSPGGRYSWPGNIRELENVIERAVAVAESDCITLND